jgi:hypothetical protein
MILSEDIANSSSDPGRIEPIHELLDSANPGDPLVDRPLIMPRQEVFPGSGQFAAPAGRSLSVTCAARWCAMRHLARVVVLCIGDGGLACSGMTGETQWRAAGG